MAPAIRLTPGGPGNNANRHIVNHDHHQGNGGISICCCRICTCINVGFLSTKTGLLKLVEVVLGSLCQTLLIQYGLPYASDIGQAFTGSLTTVASCLMTSTILLFCYVVSTRTYQLVRQSLFEVIFNVISCSFHFSAASYMAYTVNVWLYPRFLIHTAYMAYPAMTGVYYLGTLLAIVHAIDAYDSYQHFRGFR